MPRFASRRSNGLQRTSAINGQSSKEHICRTIVQGMGKIGGKERG